MLLALFFALDLRYIRRVYMRLFLLLLFFMPAFSYAAFPTGNIYYSSLTDGHKTSESACVASIAALSADESTINYPRSTFSISSTASGKCIYIEHNILFEGGEVRDSTKSLEIRFRSNSCPMNSEKIVSECICSEGFIESENQCIQFQENDPCEQLSDHCTALQGSKQFWTKSGRSAGTWTCRAATLVMPAGAEMFPGCTKGCMGENVGFDISMQNDEGQWITNGQAKMTGATCDPSVVEDLNGESDSGYEKDPTPAPTPEPDKSCPNGFKGQVNGVEVCVPPKSSSGVTELEEKDNGDGTKTSTKTEVKCSNGKCEITKTSNTTNTETNTTVSSSSVTTTVDKSDYCSTNKTAGACKDEQGENSDGNGKFGGSCQAGFTCEGDAVMCAMAKEQHKRACETLEPAKDGIWKQIEEGKDSGSAEAMKGEASTINISTQLDTNGYGLPRSCPADPVIELVFVGKSFSVPFSKVCPILKPMSDIALLITALGLLVWLVAPKGKAE